MTVRATPGLPLVAMLMPFREGFSVLALVMAIGRLATNVIREFELLSS